MIKWTKYFSLSYPENKKLLWWFSGAIFFLGIFIKLTSELSMKSRLQKFDQSVLLFIGEHLRRPALNGIAVDITALGSPTFIIIVSLITISLLIIKKDKVGLYFYLSNVIGATLWGLAIKVIVARPRPQVITHLVEVSGQSYPSGHSLIATVTYFSIAILIGRHLKKLPVITAAFTTATLLTLLTATSRLYLGVHYPTDVFSGILFGVSWVLFLTAVFKGIDNGVKRSNVHGHFHSNW